MHVRGRMIEQSVNFYIDQALQESKYRRHEYVCLEHLLWILLDRKETKNIFHSLGASLSNIKSELNDFLDKKIEKSSYDTTPELSLNIQKLFQELILHATFSSASDIRDGDIIAGILKEKDSHAAYFLKKEGVNRLDVLEEISHSETLDESNINDTNQEDEHQSTYLEDLTQKSQDGLLEPLIGREKELERIYQILLRRTKSNPLLVGDEGVGKTAIIEGLAQKITAKEVPSKLRELKILKLEVSDLLSGTKYRGEFEKRLNSIIKEVKKTKNAILFIDEIHNIVGAGATGGSSLDAANILKPLLSRGEIKCIGSTTFDEYKKHFSKDKALNRRFLKVDINEPSREDTKEILIQIAPRFETFHKVKYSKNAIDACIDLSNKYINDKHFPDKAIDLLDETGAQNHSENIIKTVGAKEVRQTISKITGLPLSSIETKEAEELINLEETLESKLFGQKNAISSISRAIRRSRAGLSEDNKPIGAFLFVGQTGVGKTELARLLSEVLNVKLIRFDMSEYAEKHSIARLIGAPPGYVGHEEGGLLSDAATKSPFSIILLDEIEKAHPDIYNILLQIFDNATLTDSLGKTASFKNNIIIMTSNVGSDSLSSKIGFGDSKYRTGLGAVNKYFRPEFLNRLDSVVEFGALNHEILEKVVIKFTKEIENQLVDKRIKIEIKESAIKFIIEQGFDSKFGARSIKRFIDKNLKDRIADLIISKKLKNSKQLVISFDNQGLSFEQV